MKYTAYKASGKMSIFVIVLLVIINIYEYFLGAMMPTEYGCSSYQVIAEGEWYRVFTYMFLHGDFQHLVMNMFALAAVGQDLAKKRGPLYIALVYFTGGISGALASMAWAIYVSGDVGTVTIGASGAIYALLGATFADQLIRLKGMGEDDNKAIKIREAVYLLIGATMLLSIRNEANVDMAAHAGGFIWGAVFNIIMYVIIHLALHHNPK